MIQAITNLPERGYDDWGSGEFGAKRGGKAHKGIDFRVEPGMLILSPVAGQVTKLGYCYKSDLYWRYVQITSSDGLDHRVFYIKPLVSLNEPVTVQTVIGEAQNIASRYTTRESFMRNHLHYEVKTKGGKYIHPETFEDLKP